MRANELRCCVTSKYLAEAQTSRGGTARRCRAATTTRTKGFPAATPRSDQRACCGDGATTGTRGASTTRRKQTSRGGDGASMPCCNHDENERLSSGHAATRVETVLRRRRVENEDSKRGERQVGLAPSEDQHGGCGSSCSHAEFCPMNGAECKPSQRVQRSA
jgi:hypothetical protein